MTHGFQTHDEQNEAVEYGRTERQLVEQLAKQGYTTMQIKQELHLRQLICTVKMEMQNGHRYSHVALSVNN